MSIASPAQDALENLGIDAVCDLISDGAGFRDIAKCAGVGVGSVLRWLDSNPGHSARALEARRVTAVLWDQEAEKAIREAPAIAEEMTRARELAQHFRWRAAKLNPRQYGDKLDLTHRGVITTMPIDMAQLTEEQREVMQDVLLLTPPTIEGEAE